MKRVIAMAGVMVALCASPAVAKPGDTVLMSSDDAGAYGASNASISADGRYVTFESDSRRISPKHAYSLGDVYRKDLRTGRIVLVSRANGLNGHRTDDDASGGAAISADGGFVAFDGSRDLHPDAAEEFTPIYLRDVKRGRLLLISRASGAHGRVQNNASYEPDVSRDGRFVAYHTEASNLDPADRSQKPDVYVRDVRHNRTLLVSRASGANGEHGNGISDSASLSDDGRYVAFSSRAHNFVADDPENDRDIYVRDLRTNRTFLASPDTDGPATNPSISADGRSVAYEYKGAVYLRDLDSATTTLVRENASDASVSADGRLVAYESQATDIDPADPYDDWDTYVRDMSAGTTTLVTRATGADGAKAYGTERGYASGVINADGSAVVFETNQHNLDPDDTDSEDDLYVRDL
jgi:Tol biopolymer transport system component